VAPTISLTPEERKAIHSHMGLDETANKRLRVLLLVDQGPDGPALSKDRVKRLVRLPDQTVDRVISLYAEMGLEFAKRPVRPTRRKLTFAQQRDILRVLETAPPEGKSRWTYKLLASELQRRGVVNSITSETVRRLLRELGVDLSDPSFSVTYDPSK